MKRAFNESILGTNFFALGEGKHSPVDLQIDEAERIDNIIDVTSKTFQGLTVACAKCHDHKFDPIPTTDYYSWYGIVKSSRFAIRTANTTQEQADAVASIQVLDQSIRNRIADAWERDVAENVSSAVRSGPPIRRASLVSGDPVDPASDELQILGDFRQGTFDGWFVDDLAFGEGPVSGLPRFDEEGRVTRLESPRVSSARTSTRLIGALRSPTFILEDGFVTVRAAGYKAHARVVVDNFQLIRNPIYGGLEIEIDGPEMKDYTFNVEMWKGREAYVEFMPGGYDKHEYVKVDSSYIEVEYAVTHAADSIDAAPDLPGNTEGSLPEAVEAWRQNQATFRQVEKLNEALGAGLLTAEVDGISLLRQQRSDLEASFETPAVFMGMVEGNGKDQPVFIRGSIQNPSDEAVPRRALSILDQQQRPFSSSGSGRLEWAKGIADTQNPLTARVMANRIWHHVFGRGIVETVDNFGIQGKLPSHPELLDYLALKFIEEGWSVKALIREMVLSDTFQRTTKASEDAMRVDPDGIWLQHYPIRRLEAEAIRDAMLSTSGTLDPTMYGESIPVYLSEFMKGRGRPAESGPLDGAGRRSIYISVRRNFLQPFMLVFDMPIPFTTFGKRNSSNVPAQSLTLLNDPFVLDQADAWARELIALKELSVVDKLNHMYLTAFSREATSQELTEAIDFLEKQAATYALDPADLTSDTRPWRDYSHVLFNTKEFIHLL